MMVISEFSVWTLGPSEGVEQTHIRFRADCSPSDLHVFVLSLLTPDPVHQLMFKPSMSQVCWQLENLETVQGSVFPGLELGNLASQFWKITDSAIVTSLHHLLELTLWLDDGRESQRKVCYRYTNSSLHIFISAELNQQGCWSLWGNDDKCFFCHMTFPRWKQ